MSVRHAPLVSEPRRLREHPAVGVEPDDLLEEVRQEKRDPARPASDIEQATATVECECIPEGVSEPGHVRRPALLVVRSAPLEEGLVPLPRLPGHERQ